jgi:hypothetical protein
MNKKQEELTKLFRNERNRGNMSWEAAFYNIAFVLILYIFLFLGGIR